MLVTNTLMEGRGRRRERREKKARKDKRERRGGRKRQREQRRGRKEGERREDLSNKQWSGQLTPHIGVPFRGPSA